MRKKIVWITRTAVLTALLISMQAITAPLGNTLITGSIVNLILIISVMLSGMWSGLTVAVLSPICAKMFGIGPFWSLIPFITLGNLALVVVWNYIGNRSFGKKYMPYISAVAVGAVAKFLVLYFGIVQIAVPLILQLPEPQASVISATFSVSQLFTALIGGAAAAVLIPLLKRALTSRG